MDEQQSILCDVERQLTEIRTDMAALHEADTQNIQCKFGISGGVLYRSWSILSGIQRFFYNENREQVCSYIIHKCNILKNIHNVAVGSVTGSGSGSDFNSRCKALILLAICKETAIKWNNGFKIILNEYPHDVLVITSIEEASKILQQIMILVVA